MRFATFAVSAVACLISCASGIAQSPAEPNANFHAGIHSGSWTLKRGQLLEEEKKDAYRSCADPYCARCAQHLADYGHEYQYVGGPSQRQLWYRGTAGSIAHVTQQGYDQHGLPYKRRGQPAAVMSWEYAQTLNHAIWEQVNARNAVASEEAAGDRVVLLTKLLEDAKEQLRLTKEAWEEVEKTVEPCNKSHSTVKVTASRCFKPFKQFCAEMKAGQYKVAATGMCEYCLAKSRYLFDQAYVADVECELARARQDYARKSAVATEAVRVALLSKEDADKATRFKRIQFKPPKYKEVLAAREAAGLTDAEEPNTEEPAAEGSVPEEVAPEETLEQPTPENVE